MTHKRLGFMQLTIMVGFGLYYTWYLIAFFGLFLSNPAGTFAESHIGQIVFFAGTVLATMGILAVFRKEESVAFGHRRFVFLASLVPGLAMPACFAAYGLGIAVPLWLFYGCCLLSGVSAAVGFMQWEDLSTNGFLNRGVRAHGIIFCAGGVLFLLSSAIQQPFERSVMSMLLLICSTALIAFIMPRCDTLEDKPVAPVRNYFKSVWHIDAVIVVTSIAFGYAFMLLYWQSEFVLLMAMGIAIAIDLVFSIAMSGSKSLQFTGAVRICTAIVSCALIAFVCPGDVTRTIALVAIIVFWFLFRTVNGGSSANLARTHEFSMLYTALRGKLPANVGFMLGISLGVSALYAGAPDFITLYVPLAIVAALILATLFLLPFDSESSAVGYKTLALVDARDSREADMQRACDMAIRQFKLSPREAEVFSYLVKGRNAKHVAEKLFISESTAKTHISNIYRKLGVHSQQELLDTLDNAA